jgi:pimeloyl-ACP methyl ester carboxylesterase
MAEVSGPSVHFSYETVGDGFPLVLAPGPQDVWSPYIPLLGELCRTIVYTAHALAEVHPAEGLHPSARAAEMLGAFLDILGLERVYLASHIVSWPMALYFALHCPGRLEGLVLIGEHNVATDAVDGIMSLEAHLPTIAVPTLVVSAAEAFAALPYADFLTAHLPRCTRLVVSDATPAASSGTPALRLAHAMMRFLLQTPAQPRTWGLVSALSAADATRGVFPAHGTESLSLLRRYHFRMECK